jgi:small conductance mechanosensitive channel
METLFPAFLHPYLPLMENFAVAIGIFAAGWIASKIVASLISGALLRAKVDPALVRFLASIGRYSTLAATVIASLGAVGVQTTSLVAIFASAGLAIGLALQGSLANFASGVMILFFRPFSLKDAVTAAGQTGSVESIDLFTTTITTPGNETVIIPNSKITGDIITNLTTKGTRRATLVFSVAHGMSLERAQEVLLSAAKRADKVLKDPAPSVLLSGFGPGSVELTLFVWGASGDYGAIQHNVRHTVYADLGEAKIAAPVQTVVVRQAT